MQRQGIRRFVFGTVAALSLALGAHAEDQNPAYKSWASHKPGTMIKMKMDTEAAGNKTSTEMTQTLVDVSPEKVTVEMKSTINVAGQKIEAPATKQEILAALPAGSKVEAPKTDAKETEESVKVGDKSYKCKVVENTSKVNDMTSTSKSWVCPEVPGMMVKMESKTEGKFSSSSKGELLEFVDK
jgi:hypothetical protein